MSTSISETATPLVEVPAPTNPFGFVTSPTVGKLYAALVKAKKAFTAIEKTKSADTGKYSYAYADLAAVIAASDPGLCDAGLSLLQVPTVVNGVVMIATTIVHESGEWLSVEPLGMPVADRNDPQKIGSAMSYGRRYARTAILGMAAVDDDDDGKRAGEGGKSKGAAAGKPREAHERQYAPADPSDERPITTKGADNKPGGQLGRLKAIMREHKVDEKVMGGYIRETWGYEKWGNIQRRHYDQIVALVQAGTWTPQDPAGSD